MAPVRRWPATPGRERCGRIGGPPAGAGTHQEVRVAKRTATRGKKRAESGVNPRQPCPCGSGKRYKAC
ncbi:SEC-C metal-binding domain-containing protein, partial [Actinoalloteichus caeruleus]|uniref:SEC-C metal-binding domain-containing protein n=1 Tax=Actinoalloteichus cyanogriseus TaxID=2893586 RepID=UPI002FFC4D23